MNKKKVIIASVSAIALIAIIVFCIILVISSMKNNKDVANKSTKTCPTGFIKVPGNKDLGTNDFCIMKYEASYKADKAVSVPGVLPWINVSQLTASDLAKDHCSDCHLVTEKEWLTIARNVIDVDSNWKLNQVGGEYIFKGHSEAKIDNLLPAGEDDNNGYYGYQEFSNGTITDNSVVESQRRTLKLSNGETIWDFAGNASEWTDGQMTGGQPGSSNDQDYSWKEWLDSDVSGFLEFNPFPGYNYSSASVWNSSNGIGKLNSNSKDETIKGFIRGGSYKDNENAGVFSLNITTAPTDANPLAGFRVVRELK